MNCKKCGTQLPDGAMFCTECGTPRRNISPAPAEAAQVPTPVDRTSSTPTPVVLAANYVQPASPRKRPVGLIVTIVLLSVLLIGWGFTAFFLLNRNSAPKTVTILGVEYDVATTTELKLNNCVISNAQLSEIAKLTNLKELWLWDCQISDITPLEKLTDLTRLNLFKNQISDITPLEKLTNLTHLNLSQNQIGDITPPANLTNLTNLDLQMNKISDITPLDKLTDLASLSLSINQISDITPLKNLTNLNDLLLGDNQISDITPLAKLNGLTYLNLGDNQIGDITPLERLTDLEELWLWENQISDSDIEGLKGKLPSCNIRR